MIYDGRKRVVIERVSPTVDCGRFPIKRVIGEKVIVRADIFADGHDYISARLLYRMCTNESWSEVPMRFLENDRWEGEKNYVELDPKTLPAHIFRIRKRLRRESDFDYYM